MVARIAYEWLQKGSSAGRVRGRVAVLVRCAELHVRAIVGALGALGRWVGAGRVRQWGWIGPSRATVGAVNAVLAIKVLGAGAAIVADAIRGSDARIGAEKRDG